MKTVIVIRTRVKIKCKMLELLSKMLKLVFLRWMEIWHEILFKRRRTPKREDKDGMLDFLNVSGVFLLL